GRPGAGEAQVVAVRGQRARPPRDLRAEGAGAGPGGEERGFEEQAAGGPGVRSTATRVVGAPGEIVEEAVGLDPRLSDQTLGRVLLGLFPQQERGARRGGAIASGRRARERATLVEGHA